jgi:glycosyltransferase involved in cell wall biosynthesis
MIHFSPDKLILRAMTHQDVKISIIIPVYNEEGNVTPLIESIEKACASLSREILVINDGSRDGTAAEINGLAKKIPALRPIHLKRNFGQTAALAAGIDHARGEIIIPLDGDGQNDPADIPRLLQKIDEGYDVVSGWRKNRQDSFVSRILPSKMANALISLISGVHLHDYGCSLKAYKASVIKNIKLAGEMHRFLPAWCVWQGGRVAEIVVEHHPRTRGRSKYGIFRTIKVVIDLFTLKFFSGFITKPNYLFSGMGFVSMIMSVAALAFALYDKFGPDRFPSFRIPFLLVSVFFGLSALFLILMGLLSEVLARLYFSVSQQKPYRLIDE